MKRSRFDEDQKIGILREVESGTPVKTVCAKHNTSDPTYSVARSIRAGDVITVLEAAVARYGAPEHLRSDNSPEFIAYVVQDWLKGSGIKTMYIKPGAPWENGHIESFRDKLLDECLNREVFRSLAEARVILEGWRVE